MGKGEGRGGSKIKIEAFCANDDKRYGFEIMVYEMNCKSS